MAIFLADSPYINFVFNLSTPVTSLEWPPSSVPKVTIIAGHLILCDGAISQNNIDLKLHQIAQFEENRIIRKK